MKTKISLETFNTKDKPLDFILVFTLLILLCVGLMALSSASSYTALVTENNSNYYFMRQLFFAVIGTALMLFVSKLNYNLYEKYGYIIYVIALLLMIMVFIPGLGSTVKGARRWIDLGLFSFQPSEFMKPALAIAIATYINKNPKKVKNLKGYIVPLVLIIIPCIIMYFQSHLSGAIVMVVIGIATILASGIKIDIKYVIGITILVAIALTIFLFSSDYRLERVKAFFNPNVDITGSNWQPTQSLYAIGSGGLFGTGLGQSRQKYLWLPESQNDFVFSIFAEEFGFIGSLVVVSLFAFLIARIISLTLKTYDLFALMLSFGITVMFAFQIVINIAVVTKLIPTTGMPLPFFSYGGTSLLINLASMGILLNITRQRRDV